MTTTKGSFDDDYQGSKLIQWLHKVTIDGGGFLQSAEDFSNAQRKNTKTDKEAINAMIRWRTAYAAGTGFVTGVGGIATLPVMIPASLATSYALGANLAAAIAHRRGYDINSDKVRAMILLCLLGESGKTILKNMGAEIGKKSFQRFIKNIPRKALVEINRRAGYRLVAKTGEKSTISLTKMVPLVGGVIGAGFDGAFVNSCGQAAKIMFPEQR